MSRYMLDTNAISALVREPESLIAQRIWKASSDCLTSIVVLAELKFGFAKRPSAVRERLLAAILETLPVLAWEEPADRHYAELRVALERAGTPIGANDMFIAAHALALDCVLVTANEREFRRVPDLNIENWAA